MENRIRYCSINKKVYFDEEDMTNSYFNLMPKIFLKNSVAKYSNGNEDNLLIINTNDKDTLERGMKIIGFYLFNKIDNVVSKKERLSEILFGLKENGLDGDGVFKIGDKVLVAPIFSHNTLCISFKEVFYVFQKEFDMEYDEFSVMIMDYIDEVLGVRFEKLLMFQ